VAHAGGVPEFFFAPDSSKMWDTWGIFRNGTFYLYYLVQDAPDAGVGLATSPDGVTWTDHGQVIDKTPDATWLGSGAIWPLVGSDPEQFILSYAEWRGGPTGTTRMFFATSDDLVNWTPLGDKGEFRNEGDTHRVTGRWDNLWAVPRAGGGYYGYWIVSRTDRIAGAGFGQSDDGLTWEVLSPIELTGVPWGPPHQESPEIAAAYVHRGRYYLLAGLDDLDVFVSEDFKDFRPGETTFVADRPNGPFEPSPKNRRLLVGNASYFTRFLDTPDGVLANHHSWEHQAGEIMGVAPGSTRLAPLKRAQWDDEGTLRLTWWDGNDAAKKTEIPLPDGVELTFDPARVLILEGELRPDGQRRGIYLDGEGPRGTAFFVETGGRVTYGDAKPDGSDFVPQGVVDREIELGPVVRFRLVRYGRITEFYLDDYLMQCYSLPEVGTGTIRPIGSTVLEYLAAWHGEQPDSSSDEEGTET
jgi:hypothetical protein